MHARIHVELEVREHPCDKKDLCLLVVQQAAVERCVLLFHDHLHIDKSQNIVPWF